MTNHPKGTTHEISDADGSLAAQLSEWQHLYEHAPCGYHSLDKNGVFIRINQTELKMLGYEREEILGKKKFSDLLTPKSKKTFQSNFPKFKHQGWIRDLAFEMVRKDGSILPVSLSATAVKDEADNFLMSRSVVLDISDRIQIEAERKQTEEKLHLAEARLRYLLSTSPAVLYACEATGDYAATFIGENISNMLGHKAWEFLEDSQFWANHIHPEDAPHVLAGLEHLFETDAHTHEYRFLHRNGSYRWVHDELKLVRDDAGNPLEIVGYWIDITDRKQTEEDLQSLNQRIVTAWESMTDAYITLDHEWKTTYANAEALKVYQILGIDLETMWDKTHWELFPQTIGQPLDLAYRRAVADNVAVHLEVEDVATRLWFEVHAYPSELGLGIYFRDITDRIQSEQKIREQASLLDIATDAIFVHDFDNRILFWNQGAERLHGWSAAEIMEQDWQQLLDPSTSFEFEPILETLKGEDSWQGEVQKMTRGGQSVTVMTRRSLMRNDVGQPKAILIVDTDITEKRQLEAQFLRTQRLESLGTLAGGIAHDLNNLLTPIIGVAQLLPLKFPDLDDQTQRLLKLMNESAHRGADLVKQILTFTRGIEGKPVSTQIRHLLAEIQHIIYQSFPKNIDLSIDLPQELWLITADATLLHQVFMNLCVNARDAMSTGGMLSIQAENLVVDENYARMHVDAKPGYYVAVTITDTGIGIPPEVMDRIFDPFFTTKEIGQGTGLGLSTVIGIVKSHCGFMNVYSELGKGSRFKVYLPAITTSEIAPSDDTTSPLGQDELILVVDDEVAAQEVTRATLETNGYRVMTANDGIEAIALYAEYKSEIRVILLDLMMPSLDATTTIRTLCKLNPQAKSSP